MVILSLRFHHLTVKINSILEVARPISLPDAFHLQPDAAAAAIAPRLAAPAGPYLSVAFRNRTNLVSASCLACE